MCQLLFANIGIHSHPKLLVWSQHSTPKSQTKWQIFISIWKMSHACELTANETSEREKVALWRHKFDCILLLDVIAEPWLCSDNDSPTKKTHSRNNFDAKRRRKKLAHTHNRTIYAFLGLVGVKLQLRTEIEVDIVYGLRLKQMLSVSNSCAICNWVGGWFFLISL